MPGVARAADRRDIVILRSLSAALDALASPAFADAFGGSTNQSDYRWGRLHRVVLAHPIGGPFNIPPAGGAFPAWGQSGDTGSQFYLNLLGRWLTNETFPLR